MDINRRQFMKRIAALAGAMVIGVGKKAHALNTSNERNWKLWIEKSKGSVSEDRYGVLVDTTSCIGCRRCEWACNTWNKNPNQPLSEFENSPFEDTSVFDKKRRMDAEAFTVVNRFVNPRTGKPIYVKRQCMHCEEAGCQSACFVDAFTKTPQGAVLHNPGVCVGCRYCMIACPFDVPGYEYNEPINPQVTKCTLCFDRISKDGGVPACVEVCPSEVMRLGKRKELLNIAHERIRNNPRRYIDHVYGEHEVGGTSWLYLSSVPFENIGFRTDLGKTPIPNLSKGFLFMTKVFEVVAAWPLVFAAYYAITKIKNKRSVTAPDTSDKEEDKHGEKK
jgi:Fe-S-cluster-containing dehydrogenase component